MKQVIVDVKKPAYPSEAALKGYRATEARHTCLRPRASPGHVEMKSKSSSAMGFDLLFKCVL